MLNPRSPQRMRFWLPEGLWFAVRYPDTDVAHKNLSLYVERLRDVTAGVVRGDVPRSRGPVQKPTDWRAPRPTSAYECLPETKMLTP